MDMLFPYHEVAFLLVSSGLFFLILGLLRMSEYAHRIKEKGQDSIWMGFNYNQLIFGYKLFAIGLILVVLGINPIITGAVFALGIGLPVVIWVIAFTCYVLIQGFKELCLGIFWASKYLLNKEPK